MAVTLLQAAIDDRQRVSNFAGSVIQLQAQYSPVMSEIPMVPNPGRFYEYEHMTTLPGFGWRGFNGAWAESTGRTTPYRETGKIAGGEVKIDVQLLRTSLDGGKRMKKNQIEGKVQASANEWDRAFFHGSELNNPDEMVGIRARILSGQIVDIATGGGALTLAKLRALRSKVPYSAGKHIEGMLPGEAVKVIFYMNRTCRDTLDGLIEAQTGSLRIEVTRNEFGQYVEKFAGAEIRVVEETGTGTSILAFNEDDGSGNEDTCSIYCVAFGEKLLHGFYNNQGSSPMLDTFEVDEMESEPRWLRRWEGYYGIACDKPRAMARLIHINAA